MDHFGEFFLAALLNADTKILSTVPLFSDIHIIHPYFKTIRVPSGQPGGPGTDMELPIVQINEPEMVFINLINMKGSAAPTEFSNKVFAN